MSEERPMYPRSNILCKNYNCFVFRSVNDNGRRKLSQLGSVFLLQFEGRCLPLEIGFMDANVESKLSPPNLAPCANYFPTCKYIHIYHVGILLIRIAFGSH